MKFDDDLSKEEEKKKKEEKEKEEKKDDDDVFINFVNQNHDDVVRRNQDDAIRKSREESLKQVEVKYNCTKNVKNKDWRKACIAVLLIIVLSFGAIKIPSALKVESRIHHYFSMMDSSTDPQKSELSIENYVGRNYMHGNDPLVSYEPWNDENFVNYVLEASRAEDPDMEVRCALIAAFKVINAPYREQQFGHLFNRIKKNEEFIKNTGFDVSKDNIWQMLGYKDMNDFENNARRDAKQFCLTEKGGNHGKGM